MFRFAFFVALSLFVSEALSAAESKVQIHLKSPEGWRGETISLPPGFARDMSWSGLEEVRFAPGMFDPKADDFFSYVFVFYLPDAKKPDGKVLRKELLKYYRGLAEAVARDKGGVDSDSFQLTVKKVEKKKTGKPSAGPISGSKVPGADSLLKPDEHFRGTLKWTEPFATMKPQTLNFEIQSGVCEGQKGRFLAVAVSPKSPDQAKGLWEVMRRIVSRTEFRSSRAISPR